MLSENELQKIDQKLCENGLFAPAIDPRGHVNNAPPLTYVSTNGVRFEIGTRGAEARLYTPTKVHGWRASSDSRIRKLVARAIEAAGRAPLPGQNAQTN